MATVKINFDTTNNPECPTIVLAKHNCVKLGLLSTVTNINVTDNLNSATEISFDLYKNIDGNDCALWDDVINFKLIWCKEWDKWFEITVEINEADSTIKNITGTSLCESELSQINLYGIEINTETDIARDDYEEPTVLYNSEDPEASLLNRIIEKVPHYSIAYVSPYIANIQRTFTFDDISIYDAMQEIAEEIECLFIFNSSTNSDGKVAREISVYDLKDNCDECGYRDVISGDTCPECGESDCITKGYGENTVIYVDNDCLTDEITLSTDTDSVKNCFKLEAGDDLMTSTVVGLNPNGSSYLWYLSEDTRAEMSDDLREKLSEYDTKISEINDYEDDSIATYNTILKKYKELDSSLELEEIDSPISGYSKLIQAYYDVIDFTLYLQTELLPSVEINNTTTSAAQAKLLQNSSNTKVGTITDIDTMSKSTADSYILSVAKNIINRTYYGVKINSSTYNTTTHKWSGIFKVTSLTDDEDTATTSTVTMTISNDYSLYVEQRVKSTIKLNSDDEDTDYIIDLFGEEYKDKTSFTKELKKHSLDSLNNLYDMCQTVLDVLIQLGLGADSTTYSIYDANSSDCREIYTNYYNKLQWINEEIGTRETELETVSKLEDFIVSTKEELQENLNIEKFLGETLWTELSSFRRESTYSNSNFISDGLNNAELFKRANEFYELAESEIKDAATPQYSISTTLNNLLVIPELKSLSDYFEVGNWINMRIDGTLYKLRLISYTVDYENLETISVEFSNVTKFNDVSSNFEDILNQATSMASSYDYVAHQTSQFTNSSKILSEWVNKGLDATNVMITNNSDNQSIVFDEHGILCRQYDDVLEDYSDYQVKIINRGLYFTSDNWKNVKTGIGNFIYYDPENKTYKEGYGVIADTIVSNIILSEEIGVYTTNSTIKIGGTNDSGLANGLTITANEDTNNDSVLFTVQKKISDDEYEKMLYIDSDGNLQISGSSVEINVSSLDEKINNVSIREFLINNNFSKAGTWTITEKTMNSQKVSVLLYDGTESWTLNSQFSDIEITDSYKDTQALKFYQDGTGIGSLAQQLSLNAGTYTVEIIAATDSEDEEVKFNWSYSSNTGSTKTLTNDFDTYTYTFTLSKDYSNLYFSFYTYTNANYYIKSIRLYCEITEYYDQLISSLSVTAEGIKATVSNITTGEGTEATLDENGLKVSWSNISEYVSIEDGGLYIRDSENSDLTTLTNEGLVVYNGAIKVLDGNNNKVFYTDSEGNTIFSGNLSVISQHSSNASTVFNNAVTIDSNGLFIKSYYSNSWHSSMGFQTDGRINPRMKFYYLEDGYGESFAGQISVEEYAEGVSDLGYGIDLTVEGADNNGNGAVRIIGCDNAELRVGYGQIIYQGELVAASDKELKINISNLSEKLAMSIIQSLTPTQYNFKNDGNQIKHYGLIAQDVEQVLRDNGVDTANLALISKPNDHMPYYSLSYIEIIPLLINAIKYQQQEIKELKNNLEENN